MLANYLAGLGVCFRGAFIRLNRLVNHVFTAQPAIKFVALACRLTSPWQCICALFSRGGRRDISLPPLTLVDVVVLRRVRRKGQAGSEQNFVCVLRASKSDLPEF